MNHNLHVFLTAPRQKPFQSLAVQLEGLCKAQHVETTVPGPGTRMSLSVKGNERLTPVRLGAEHGDPDASLQPFLWFNREALGTQKPKYFSGGYFKRLRLQRQIFKLFPLSSLSFCHLHNTGPLDSEGG